MAARRRRVVWTEQARQILDDAVSYVAQDSRPAAERLLIQALEAASSLDAFSERGRIVPELSQVLAFIHGARDLTGPGFER